MKNNLLNKALLSMALFTVAGTTNAINIDVTEFIYGQTYAADGTLTDSGNFGSVNSIDPFFNTPWVLTGEAYFDFGTTGITWEGTTTIFGTISPFSYEINLTSTQVAWGTYWNWSVNNDVPVLVIMDCGVGNPGDICTGIGTPMVSGPFPGGAQIYNGTVSAVPLPSAILLFGSGFIGLVGIARSKNSPNNLLPGQT